MLNQWLTEDTVNIVDSIDTWQQAVRLTSVPLLEQDKITRGYIQAIYQIQNSTGPYYLLAPHVAVLHARPEQGANKLGLSMLLVKNGVNFNSLENDPIRIIFVLAAPDNNSHIDLLTQLTELIDDQDSINAICQAQNKQEIIDIINKD